jgi:hypothetical protein
VLPELLLLLRVVLTGMAATPAKLALTAAVKDVVAEEVAIVFVRAQ